MEIEEEIIDSAENFETENELLGSEEIVEDFNILQESLDLENSENTDKKAEETLVKQLKLPLTRIKTIIKTDPDVSLASHDAVVLLAKATVRFI